MHSLMDLAASGLEAFIYLAIIVLLFVFLVRPAVELLLAKPHRQSEPPAGRGERRVGGGGTASSGEEVAFDHPRGGMPQAEVFERLAASDPEKAGALVKKWLQEKE